MLIGSCFHVSYVLDVFRYTHRYIVNTNSSLVLENPCGFQLSVLLNEKIGI